MEEVAQEGSQLSAVVSLQRRAEDLTRGIGIIPPGDGKAQTRVGVRWVCRTRRKGVKYCACEEQIAWVIEYNISICGEGGDCYIGRLWTKMTCK